MVGLAASYYAVTEQMGAGGGTSMEQVRDIVHLGDLAAGVFKDVVFGRLVAIVLPATTATARSSATARRASAWLTNRAIVHSAVLCIVLNMFMSALLYVR